MAAETVRAAAAPRETAVPDERVTRGPGHRSAWRKAGSYTLLVILAVIVLFPVYIVLLNSVLPPSRLFQRPPALVPTDVSLDGYRTAFDQGLLGRYLLNSFIVSILITAMQVLTSILSGYAFGVLRFPFRNTLFVLFLATLMVPTEVTIIANFQTIQRLDWLDSYQALTVPFFATAVGTFLLRQAFMTMPPELLDAAQLDGYGRWRFLWRVAVPLARPAIGAVALYGFLTAWNQYLWPLLVTNDDEYRTIQIGIRQLISSDLDEANLLFATAVLAILPLAVLLIAFQKQIVRGLTAGAVKG